MADTKKGRPKNPDAVINEGEGATLRMSEQFRKYLGNTAGTWTLPENNLQAHNPFLQNSRLKKISDIPGAMSLESLAEALKEPQNNEQNLRQQGWALSATQYLYYKILRMAADVPLFKYYKTPEYLEKESDYNKPDFIREDKYVDEWLQAFDLPTTLKRVSLDVKREGKAVYVLRNSICQNGSEKHVNYCTWQKMPSNYVKLTGIGEHGYTASFNMLLFMNPAFSIEQYPEFMKTIWSQMLQDGVIADRRVDPKPPRNYTKIKDTDYAIDLARLSNYTCKYSDSHTSYLKRGILEGANSSYMFWVELPQELCYVFSSDTSHAWVVPDTMGLFLGLQELADYDTLAGLIASTPLTTLFTGEVPLIAEANLNAGADQTALSPDTILGYQNKLNESVSSNIDAYIAPLKNMKLQSLPNIPNSSDVTTKATQNFISRAGMGGLISATDKPSVAAIKAAQLLYEAECDFLTRQFESVLTMIINRLIGTKYIWRLHIWGGIYTFDSEVKRDKELFIAGGTFVLPKIASAYNMTLRDLKASDTYIKSLGLYDDFKTITQAQVENANAESGESPKKQGRPNADENNIESDATAASLDLGENTGDMRDFAIHCFSEGKCMICGHESDTLICEDCANVLYDALSESESEE